MLSISPLYFFFLGGICFLYNLHVHTILSTAVCSHFLCSHPSMLIVHFPIFYCPVTSAYLSFPHFLSPISPYPLPPGSGRHSDMIRNTQDQFNHSCHSCLGHLTYQSVPSIYFLTYLLSITLLLLPLFMLSTPPSLIHISQFYCSLGRSGQHIQPHLRDNTDNQAELTGLYIDFAYLWGSRLGTAVASVCMLRQVNIQSCASLFFLFTAASLLSCCNVMLYLTLISFCSRWDQEALCCTCSFTMHDQCG